MRRAGRLAIAALAALGAAPSPVQPEARDVYLLRDGDRISGRTLTKGKRAFVVQTPYGRLTLPRARVARVRWADGREELLYVEPTPPPPPPPPPPRPALVVVVTGQSFWYAWDPREAGVDPSLRLELRLDEAPLAVYTDDQLDPQDLPGATVNSFSFDPQHLRASAEGQASAAPPEARPGRVSLRLELPAESAGAHRLRFAYQINAGSRDEPAWRDVAQAELDVELRGDAPALVAVHQDAGRMEFHRRRMKAVETFRLDVHLSRGAPADEPPAPPAPPTLDTPAPPP